MNLSLHLTPEQEKDLIALSNQFKAELEREKTPFPSLKTLQTLKEKLLAVLKEQEGFEDAEASKAHP